MFFGKKRQKELEDARLDIFDLQEKIKEFGAKGLESRIKVSEGRQEMMRETLHDRRENIIALSEAIHSLRNADTNTVKTPNDRGGFFCLTPEQAIAAIMSHFGIAFEGIDPGVKVVKK